MGTDPENPNYPPGVDCLICQATLFDGVTPKYVEAHFEGIVDCPAAPPRFRNGVFLLTQTGVTCQWVYLENPWAIEWRLTGSGSLLRISITSVIWFLDDTIVTCQTVFTNSTICGIGFNVGTGGTGKIFWGPTIGP